MNKKTKENNLGFWKGLKKPFFVLAPMADVTDLAFRQMFVKYGKPDVLWTEFVSADGLCLAPSNNVDKTGLSGHGKLWKDLQYLENERPIIAQLFSGNPKMMEKASYMVTKAGFDGIDINMGCPERSIQKQKAGAALIQDFDLAVKIIRATKKGIKKACKEMKNPPAGGEIPLSVKTRIGYNKDIMEEWLSVLLKEEIAVITVHARTKKELSKVPAKWNRVKDAVLIRNKLNVNTFIIGNGDVKSIEDAEQKAMETGCDGVMIGRGAFGTPWFFNKKAKGVDSVKRLKMLSEHIKLFEKYLYHKSFNIMKKHFKAYVNGFEGAKDIREKLMQSSNTNEAQINVRKAIKDLTKT